MGVNQGIEFIPTFYFPTAKTQEIFYESSDEKNKSWDGEEL